MECYYQDKNGIWGGRPDEWHHILDSLNDMKKADSNFKPVKIQDNSPCILYTSAFLEVKGKQQINSWAIKMFNALNDSDITVKRLNIFQNQLTNQDNPNFLIAREKYELERSILEVQTKKLKILRIQSAEKYLFILASIYASILILCIGCSILLIWSANNIVLFSTLKKWKHIFFYFTLSLFLMNTSLSIITSILESDKQWIVPSSFFVSRDAWYWERFSVLGLCLIEAIPLTQLWCYTRKEFIPKISLTNLSGDDGKFAIEKYILFLQVCTITIFIVLSLITVILLKWSSSQQDSFDNYYLIGVIFISISLLFLIIRLIKNAILMRLQYQNSLSELSESPEEFQKAKILPDPTIEFIGESWWKLPVNFISILTAIWAVFNLTGIADIILNALK